jgi:hypothetical protein
MFSSRKKQSENTIAEGEALTGNKEGHILRENLQRSNMNDEKL